MKIDDDKKTIFALKDEITQYEIDKHLEHGYTVRVRTKYGVTTHTQTRDIQQMPD